MKKIITKFSLLFIGLMLCAGNAWGDENPYHDPDGNSGNGYYEETINGVTYRVDYTYSRSVMDMSMATPAFTVTTISRTITSKVKDRPIAKVTGFNGALPYVFIGATHFDIETYRQVNTHPYAPSDNSTPTSAAVCIPKGTFLNYSGVIFLPTWNTSNTACNVYYSGEGDADPVYDDTFGANAHVMVYQNSDLSNYTSYAPTFIQDAQNTNHPVQVWNGHLTVFPSGDVPELELEGDFGTNNALHWSFYDDGSLYINVNDPETPAAMPDLASYQAAPVWVGAGVTESEIVSVHIGSGVTHVGNYSFYQESNSHIISVTFEDNSVTSIGDGAFRGAIFSSITLPSNLLTIGNFAFNDCDNLTEITIPSSVTGLYGETFVNSGNLATVTMLGSTPPAKTNGFSMFSGTAVSTIVIPDGTVCDYKDAWGYSLGGSYVYKYSAGGDAVECAAQTSGTCGTNLNWSIDEGVLTISGTGTTMTNYNTDGGPWNENFKTDITSVVIEAANLTNIGNNAFRSCTNLATVTLGASVTTIGTSAFDYCSAIAEPIYNSHVFVKMPNAWLGTHGGDYVIVDGTELIYSSAFEECTNLTSITMPDDVTTIGGWAFYGCSNLASVTLGDNVTTVGNRAFQGCTALTTPLISGTTFFLMPTSYSGAYTIPDGIENINGSAFEGCTSLTTITIPNSVKTIGASAFSNCNNANFTTVTIPNSVTSIETSAFRNCSHLTSVTLPSGLSTIPGSLFNGCTSLTALHMRGVAPSSIGYNAFNNVSGTVTFYVPKGTYDDYDNLLDGNSYAPTYIIVEENTYGDATAIDEKYAIWADDTYAEASYNALVASASAHESVENFTIVRPIQANGYLNTICLPFDLSEAQIANSDLADAEIFAFDAQNTGAEIEMVLNEVTEMEAGMPYFFRYPNGAADAPNMTELNFHDVTVKTATSVAKTVEAGTFRLKGTLQNTLLNSSTNYLFLGAEDALFYPDFGGAGVTNDDLTLRPFRAYFEATGGANNAPARFVFGRKTPTDVESIQSSVISSQKIIENGQVIIIRNGVRYNVAGQVVK